MSQFLEAVSECELLLAANRQGFKPVVHSLFNNHLVDVQMDSVRNLITETCYNQLERSGEFKEVLQKNNMKREHTILHTRWCLSHSAIKYFKLMILISYYYIMITSHEILSYQNETKAFDLKLSLYHLRQPSLKLGKSLLCSFSIITINNTTTVIPKQHQCIISGNFTIPGLEIYNSLVAIAMDAPSYCLNASRNLHNLWPQNGPPFITECCHALNSYFKIMKYELCH